MLRLMFYCSAHFVSCVEFVLNYFERRYRSNRVESEIIQIITKCYNYTILPIHTIR